MYIDENKNRIPRERVDDSILRHMLNGGTDGSCRGDGDGRGVLPCNPDSGTEPHRLMNFPLGMVYSPIQQWRNAYDTDEALKRGTLFRELDLPWEVPAPTTGKGGCCRD